MGVTSSLTSGETLFFVLVLSLIFNPCHADRDIKTSPSQDTQTTYIGRAYLAEFGSEQYITAKFLGIPFAHPPTRFDKPVLDTPKEGNFTATKFGGVCPQSVGPGNTCIRSENISENCLYLNIYVPLHNVKKEDLGITATTTFTTSISTSTTSRSTSTALTSTITASLPPSTAATSTNSATTTNTVNSSTAAASPSSSTMPPNTSTVSITSSTLLTAETPASNLSATTHETLNSSASEANQKAAPAPPENGNGETLNLPSANTKYAVLIYIHGGAFFEGSGNCDDGSVLAGHGDIIVVTINYRLGNLGFLSTNDDVIPGNLGLWDQHVAIQWVKKHIHVFGGDPDRITVGGQSAGSYSSIYQALYDGNARLFQRVIAQSGTPTAVKSASSTGYNSTLEVAKRLNCNTATTKQEVKSCLMTKTAEELVNVHLPMLVPGSLPVQPTVDDPLVPEDPYTILSQMAPSVSANKSTVPQHFISKDILIGVDAQDGDIVLRLYAYILASGNNTLYSQLLSSPIYPTIFKELIRNYFQKSYSEIIDDSIIEAVLDRYTDWENPNDYNSLSNRVIDVFTDAFFAIPVLDTASAHIQSHDQGQHRTPATNTGQNGTGSHNTQGGTFVYKFSLPVYNDKTIPWFQGTGHSSEIAYVFGDGRLLQGETQINLAKTVMTYWSNFVKSGDPNRDSTSDTAAASGNSSFPLPIWQEYNNNDEQYLEISGNSVSKSRMRANYRHFWTKYIPKLRDHLQYAFNDGVNSVEKCPDKKSNGKTILRDNSFVWTMLWGLTFAFSRIL